MIFLGGITLITFGLLNLFAPDLMWSLTVLNNKWEGKASERSDWWNLGRKIGGVFLIICGIVLFIFGLIEPGMKAKAEEESRRSQQEFDTRLEQQRKKLMQEYMDKVLITEDTNNE